MNLIIAYTEGVDENRLIGLQILLRSISVQTTESVVTLVEDLQGKERSSLRVPKNIEHITIQDPQHRKFNKAWVMNVGARCSKEEGLIFIDAEMSFGSYFVELIAENAKKWDFFNCWSSYICMPGRDNPNKRVHVFPKTVSCLIGAFYSTKKFFFERLGGYNENYFGYGGEDNDIFWRAQHILGSIPFMTYEITHNYHHWHPKDGPNPLNEQREEMMNITKNDPASMIKKLVSSKIGDIRCPTLV